MSGGVTIVFDFLAKAIRTGWGCSSYHWQQGFITMPNTAEDND